MKKFYYAFVGVLTVLILIWNAGPLRSGDGNSKKNQLTWLSFEQGLAASKKEKKMMVVDFYTDWCGWCKVMDRETYANESVVKFAKARLVMVKVNAESNEKTRFRGQEYSYRQLAMAFGVTGYPATAFVDANGEVITLVPGYVPPDKFLPVLEYLDGGHYKNMKFEEYIEKRKK
jgi:thioredoxin-related protein